ncbi:homoserine dehydrogenase [Aspergillus novoparasiticus]|uniref:Homoserine dehydrogenase n=1 Tax=Aspergillus novoparasiticus TaxID=986946 RepID=A0A5N6EJY4_9EURO|nr:homoserine dehydrogenase [Aspergillus novoparasiticus]
MSFHFNSFSPTEGQGKKWPVTVRKAKQLGYTEPDPRDDLSGLDVTRKRTILGRLAGSCTECQVEINSLTIFRNLTSKWKQHKAAAEKEGKCVHFVGSIDMASREVKVGIESFEKTHPIAALQGGDNVISFYTKRYGDNPLIVQGAGAGGDMGVSSDLLKVLSHIAW